MRTRSFSRCHPKGIAGPSAGQGCCPGGINLLNCLGTRRGIFKNENAEVTPVVDNPDKFQEGKYYEKNCPQ